MKTNYAQHLAWFEHSVKPNVLTHQQQETRCWHATTTKRVVAFEHYDNSREDTQRILSNPRKRQRIQEDSPFLTTMEEDMTMPTSPLTINDTIEFEQVSDMETILIDEEEENQAVKSDIFRNTSNIPVRTTSEISLYYDANDHWENTNTLSMPGTPIPEKIIPPPTSSSSRREEIETVLLDKFKLRGFIPNQYEAITAAIDKQDILVVLPSGPSRNVCYQLPILFQHPKLITIVLVPSLIDLLEKDDHTIETHTISTLFVCKSKKTYKKNWISQSELTLAVLKQTQLIYMTFNDFNKCKKLIHAMYKENLLSRFILDQVHCISQWGDDFYFGYLRTTETLKETYAIPITALTALPNERIHVDIIHQLKLKHCKIFKKSILF